MTETVPAAAAAVTYGTIAADLRRLADEFDRAGTAPLNAPYVSIDVHPHGTDAEVVERVDAIAQVLNGAAGELMKTQSDTWHYRARGRVGLIGVSVYDRIEDPQAAERKTAPDADTIPTADLMDIVRRHAHDNGWCNDAEDDLERFLGLRFRERGCDCGGPDCIARNERLGRATERFTLVPDAPETVSRAAVQALMAEEARWEPELTAAARAEAAKRFGLEMAR